MSWAKIALAVGLGALAAGTVTYVVLSAQSTATTTCPICPRAEIPAADAPDCQNKQYCGRGYYVAGKCKVMELTSSTCGCFAGQLEGCNVDAGTTPCVGAGCGVRICTDAGIWSDDCHAVTW